MWWRRFRCGIKIVMKKTKFLIGLVFLMIFSVVVSAYPVYTTWYFNKNYVDFEAYHCNDNICSSVTGPFFSGNTGPSSSVSISYDVPESCGNPHYTAYYFYKDCHLPMEGYVWSTCEFTYTDNINFYKKAECKSEILSLNIPATAKTGETLQITATVKSALTEGMTPPKYIPTARKDYYSSNVAVNLAIRKDGSTVNTESKTLNIFQDTTQDVSFYWTPSEPGSYSIEVSTDVTDCKCYSSVRQSASRSITVQKPNTHPKIEGIPDFSIKVGQTIKPIDLYTYASDSEDPDPSLGFSIESQSNVGVI
ncbi:MAG: hypothetical protein QW286_02385, partial [Candidatus Aenigmatarchaeota archaeon]